MNEDAMFEYLVQMGMMRPEEAQLKKKQSMVDALRGNSLSPMQGQMVGKHYVAPGIGQAIAQLGQGYLAGKGQEGVDKQMGTMNTTQAANLKAMRDRMQAERLRQEQLRREEQMLQAQMSSSGTGGQQRNQDQYAGFRQPTTF
tara:strand:- start:31 stop:459 length:429 start_codon:yes stop_codon:yes gene_type:complete